MALSYRKGIQSHTETMSWGWVDEGLGVRIYSDMQLGMLKCCKLNVMFSLLQLPQQGLAIMILTLKKLRSDRDLHRDLPPTGIHSSQYLVVYSIINLNL